MRQETINYGRRGTVTVKYNRDHEKTPINIQYINLRLLVFSSAVESTLLLIRIHLPPSRTWADISFVVADVTQQGVDFNCVTPSVRFYLPVGYI